MEIEYFHHPNIDGTQRFCNMCIDGKYKHKYTPADHYHIILVNGKQVASMCLNKKCLTR